MNEVSRDPRRAGSSDGFRFHDHPWISLAVFLLLTVLVFGTMGTLLVQVFGLPADSRAVGFIGSLSSHLFLLFVIAPFALRLPRGSRSFPDYLKDIGLTRVRPTGRLVFLALSCYVILAASQVAGSITYRLVQGFPLTREFVGRVLDVGHELPPASLSLLYSLPSALEEIGSRGIILTLFLASYSRRRSLVVSAAGFAVLHLLNLAGGRDPTWVLGQVGWSFLMGLFYGYLFVRTRSLLPPMLVHYLGNVFVGSLNGYVQSQAPVEVQALYGVIFTFGAIPVTLMILWVRLYTTKWPLENPADGR